MNPFVFRLQNVLDYRKTIEAQKEQEYSKTRSDYLKEKEKLEGLQRKLQSCTQSDWGYTDAFHYQAMYNYMEFMAEKIDSQIEITDRTEGKMNEKKAEYTDSRKDRKIIDKLKENAFKDYKHESDSAEQKQNDEFALYGYMRK